MIRASRRGRVRSAIYANMSAFVWTTEAEGFLRENYSVKGKMWCAEQMGLREGQIRSKAARLGLRSIGSSEAWKRGRVAMGKTRTGEKRPAQSEVMKRLHREGKIKRTEAGLQSFRDQMKEWHRTHEHPRGALGMRHTAEAKARISENSLKTWDRMTEEEKGDRNMKILKTREANGTLTMERPSASWKAGWREIGGTKKYYRSRWEANYAHYLQWLKERKQIADWKHEPKTFWFEGIKRGVMTYLPDFWVLETNGSEAYHEVKGWMDDASKTKIRRMAKYHPDVRLIVIDAKGYRALARSLLGLVPGWEGDEQRSTAKETAVQLLG